MSAKTVTRSLLCLSAIASALPVFNPAAQAAADAINGIPAGYGSGFPPTSYNELTPSSFPPATYLTSETVDENGNSLLNVDESEEDSLLELLPGQTSAFNGEGTIVHGDSTESEQSGFFGSGLINKREEQETDEGVLDLDLLGDDDEADDEEDVEEDDEEDVEEDDGYASGVPGAPGTLFNPAAQAAADAISGKTIGTGLTYGPDGPSHPQGYGSDMPPADPVMPPTKPQGYGGGVPPPGPPPQPSIPPKSPVSPPTYGVPPADPVMPPTKPTGYGSGIPPADPVTPPKKPAGYGSGIPPADPVTPPTKPTGYGSGIPPADPVTPPTKPTGYGSGIPPADPVTPPKKPSGYGSGIPPADPVTPPTKPTGYGSGIPPADPVTPPTKPAGYGSGGIGGPLGGPVGPQQFPPWGGSGSSSDHTISVKDLPQGYGSSLAPPSYGPDSAPPSYGTGLTPSTPSTPTGFPGVDFPGVIFSAGDEDDTESNDPLNPFPAGSTPISPGDMFAAAKETDADHNPMGGVVGGLIPKRAVAFSA